MKKHDCPYQSARHLWWWRYRDNHRLIKEMNTNWCVMLTQRGSNSRCRPRLGSRIDIVSLGTRGKSLPADAVVCWSYRSRCTLTNHTSGQPLTHKLVTSTGTHNLVNQHWNQHHCEPVLEPTSSRTNFGTHNLMNQHSNPQACEPALELIPLWTTIGTDTLVNHHWNPWPCEHEARNNDYTMDIPMNRINAHLVHTLFNICCRTLGNCCCV